jgi:hypothetical protein
VLANAQGMSHTAFYAGSFDPVTNGHLDIAMRLSRYFLPGGLRDESQGSRDRLASADAARQA